QEYIDIQDQKGRQFSTLYTKERLIKQFKELKDQLVKEIKRTAHQFKEETKKELTISNTFESQNYIYIFDKVTTINYKLWEIDNKELTTEKLEEFQYQYYQLIKTIITYFIPKSKLDEYSYLEFRRKH
ncbi:19043_t:CDS:1, partial [Gigaspora rosea]